MKKVMSNFLRYVLIFTTMVSGCLCAVSITGIVIDSSLGMYNNELNEVTRNGQKNLAGFYSRHIFEKMVRQNDPGCMENSNLEYVIVKGVNPNEDINSKANTEKIIWESAYSRSSQELTENPSYEREALIIRNAEFLWAVPVENVKSVSLLRSQRIPLPLFFYKGRGFS